MLTIPIRLSAYLSEWLTRRYGSPATFPKGSYENAIMARSLMRPPHGTPRPLTDREALRQGLTLISAPAVHGKPHETHYHLPKAARQRLARAVSMLFTIDLWESLAPAVARRKGIENAIEQWARSRGIRPEHREAVRRRLYRMRLRYQGGGKLRRSPEPQRGDIL